MDNCAHKELKKQQEDEEDDMFEEEDTDEEDECDEDVEMSSIDSRAKQMFKEEFYSAGYSNFLQGQNKDFDYRYNKPFQLDKGYSLNYTRFWRRCLPVLLLNCLLSCKE